MASFYNVMLRGKTVPGSLPVEATQCWLARDSSGLGRGVEHHQRRVHMVGNDERAGMKSSFPRVVYRMTCDWNWRSNHALFPIPWTRVWSERFWTVCWHTGTHSAQSLECRSSWRLDWKTRHQRGRQAWLYWWWLDTYQCTPVPTITRHDDRDITSSAAWYNTILKRALLDWIEQCLKSLPTQ